MFAVLLHENMDAFYDNISSFPTAIFTILLGVAVVYWAGAVLGLLDLDIINIDVDIDLNADSAHSSPDVFAALMMRCGLVGVPVVITLSLIILMGWLICYYLVHFTVSSISNGYIRFLLGVPIFAISLVAAAWLTSHLIKPLRKLFKHPTTQNHKHILGQRAVVRTSRVDTNFGEATLDDGGAGIILKIRASENETFSKGDRVVIFERLTDDNIYRVISEEEFSGQ